MARTGVPIGGATVMRPADGAENSAAPQTELTSAKVPMNSAKYTRVGMVSISPLQFEAIVDRDLSGDLTPAPRAFWPRAHCVVVNSLRDVGENCATCPAG